MKKLFAMADVTFAAWLLASLSAVSPASAGGPAIKTQQCNVTFPTTSITLTPDVYVANRGGSTTSSITKYAAGTFTETGATQSQIIEGSAASLYLTSKNYHVGIVLDGHNNIYVAEPNQNAVKVYRAGADADTVPVTDVTSVVPIGSLAAADGLSQPAGLAYDLANKVLYVANAGNGTVTAYSVDETGGSDGGPKFVKKSPTATGLSLPLGLALSGGTLYVANRGSNSIAALDTAKFDEASNFTASSTVNLKDMTGPLGIAVEGNYLYVANNGKYNGSYSVTIHFIGSGLDASDALSAPVHLGGVTTGLCNPAAVAVGNGYLYVANRESSGGSITVYDLAHLPSPSTANADIPPVAMMLHDPTTNELAGPVGLYVVP